MAYGKKMNGGKKMSADYFNPKKGDLHVNQEFPGSAGKGKKLPEQEKTSRPEQEFSGSSGKGSLPKGNC